jgi:hypothetical protein
MKPQNHILTCTLTILAFSCPSFSQTDSNRPDLSLSEQPQTALAGVDSVWISFYKSKTPGVPYIPDPCLDREKIQERLKLAGINRVSMPFLNRKPDAPLPANLRIKIYIHNFNITDPYIFYIGLSIARPVVIPAVMDSPFYAEVWHSDGVIGTASEQDLQEKINKALIDQLDDIIVWSKTTRSVSSQQEPNQPSPKLGK